MITNDFEHISDIGESGATLRCNACGEEVIVDFDILRPKHVQYDLGTNEMTIVCPHCDAVSTTTRAEYELFLLKVSYKLLSDQFKHMLSTQDIKFTIVNHDAIANGEAEFRCTGCGTDFPTRTEKHPLGAINVHQQPGALFIICPCCQITDCVDDENIATRRAMAVAGSQVAALKKRILELSPDEELD